jgi:hypothetical protein
VRVEESDIATVWINYARGITNRTKTTPAQALEVMTRAYRVEEILAWRQDLEGIALGSEAA